MRTMALFFLLAACGSPPKPAAPESVAPTTSEAVTVAPAPSRNPSVLRDVSRKYDRGDYAGARSEALAALATGGDDARMIRIVVSADCRLGDGDEARRYWVKLSDPRDRDQIARRCGRLGITLP